MRNILTTLALGTVIAMGAFAADDTLGTWKLNLDKSKFTPPSAPVKSLTITREGSDGGVKVTNTGERADGVAIKAGYSAKYDGKDNPVTGNAPYDTIAIKSISPSTFTYTAKSGATKYKVIGRTVVSKDGKTMTNTIRGTDTDGKPITYIMVFDKP